MATKKINKKEKVNFKKINPVKKKKEPIKTKTSIKKKASKPKSAKKGEFKIKPNTPYYKIPDYQIPAWDEWIMRPSEEEIDKIFEGFECEEDLDEEDRKPSLCDKVNKLIDKLKEKYKKLCLWVKKKVSNISLRIRIFLNEYITFEDAAELMDAFTGASDKFFGIFKPEDTCSRKGYIEKHLKLALTDKIIKRLDDKIYVHKKSFLEHLKEQRMITLKYNHNLYFDTGNKL